MQAKIAEILYNAEKHISGQQISQELGVSRQAVNKAVKNLRDKGFEIESITNKGYKLTKMPATLCEEAICCYLNTKLIGKKIKVLDTVGSTNDYLKKLGSKGAEAGTVVLAREQTAGKGRLGRVWQTPKDECVALSLLLRPEMSPAEISSITPLTGLAVCSAVNDFCKLDSRIKWPNDIIVKNKKLVGILTEMSAEFDRVDYTVTGIGINVGQATFPDDIAHKATSVLLETGRHIDRNRFVACVLEHLERELIDNHYVLSGTSVKDYQSLCATIGRSVTFTRGQRKISGMAVGISNSGELEVMLSNGTIANVNSGEVTVQGIY